LGVEVSEQRQVLVEDTAGDRGTGQRQRIPGGRHQPLRAGAGDLDVAGGGEPDEPAGAQRGQAGRVGELGGDQPTDLEASRLSCRSHTGWTWLLIAA